MTGSHVIHIERVDKWSNDDWRLPTGEQFEAEFAANSIEFSVLICNEYPHRE